ncbi:helix-turn-helix domain-containing protein [Pedobacter sp. SG918]|uniref:AlbA family DNA-binding domain-containing protein n=1 Tax=Pedobacter sp. SG918 TaxID=2587136 RepID=UPI00146A5200|nr:ATP-binding protein [Pedobacter sp. SG918]NMN37735.1 hypothetical protein [Pedobacter sp. SG918]
MKSFYDKEDYTIEDIQSLIDNQVEESIYLDFKSAGSLAKDDKKRMELSKDVASFANSDGGIIVYGIKEVDHVASEFSFIDGNEFTKEWIEQVISSYVQRRISGVKIYPIRVDGDIKKSVYIVKIPYSYDAPHLSKDNRYYKRYNFMSVPMEEYEVRQTYGRKSKSDLKYDGYYSSIKVIGNDLELSLDLSVRNNGKSVENDYKMNIHINSMEKELSLHWLASSTNLNYTRLSDSFKISADGVSALFANESLCICRFTMKIPKRRAFSLFQSMKMKVVVLFSSGYHIHRLDTSNLWEHVKEKFDELEYDWITDSEN